MDAVGRIDPGTFRRRWGCRAVSGRLTLLAPRAFGFQTGVVLEPRPYAVRNLRLPREPRVHPLSTCCCDRQDTTTGTANGGSSGTLTFVALTTVCFGSSGSDRAFAGIASRDIECTLSTF